MELEDLRQEAAIAALAGTREATSDGGDAQLLVAQRVERRLRDVVLSARHRASVGTERFDARTPGQAPCQEVIADAARKWAGLTDAQRAELASG